MEYFILKKCQYQILCVVYLTPSYQSPIARSFILFLINLVVKICFFVFIHVSHYHYRVSPSDDVDRPAKEKRSSQMARGDSGSSPDPLEPWSTKDLTNMNQILGSQ